MALGLCIQFIDLSTRRNIEQTPCVHVRIAVVNHRKVFVQNEGGGYQFRKEDKV